MTKEYNNVNARTAAFKAYIAYAKEAERQYQAALEKFDERDPTGLTGDAWLADQVRQAARNHGEFNAWGFEAQAIFDWAIDELCDRTNRRNWDRIEATNLNTTVEGKKK